MGKSEPVEGALAGLEELRRRLEMAERDAHVRGDLILAVENGRWEIEWCALDGKRNITEVRDTIPEVVEAVLAHDDAVLRAPLES